VYGAGSNSYNTGWQSPSGTNFYPYLSNGNYGAYAPGVAVNGSSELNFGVQYTNVSQTINIPRALPNVQVTGYEYGFSWKNGNYWDNKGTDWLTAYVNIYDKNNRAIVQDNYNLAWNSNDWRWFGVNKTFTTPYESSLLSTAKFGFTGQDYNGNWWGYYGPEVGSISFRLKYSMDECSINPLARSNCSGYLDALKRLSVAPVTTTYSAPSAIASMATARIPSVSSTVEVAPTPITSVTDTANTTSVVPTVATTQTYQGGGQSQASTATATASASTTSTTSTVTSTTNTGAQPRVAYTPAPIVTPMAASVASTAYVPPQTNTNTNTNNENTGYTPPPAVLSTSDMGIPSTNATGLQVTSSQSYQPSIGLSTRNMDSSYRVGAISMIGSQMNSSQMNGSQTQQFTEKVDYGITKFDNEAVKSSSVSNSTDVVGTFKAEQTTQATPVSAAPQSLAMIGSGQFLPGVNKIVDVAPEPVSRGEVEDRKPQQASKGPPLPIYEVTMEDLIEQRNLNVIAQMGVNVSMYVNRSYIDAPFYKVKSVYENQAVIDNSRGQRLMGLGSERKWTEMVDQQYKGN
jgi:hypothetical protein